MISRTSKAFRERFRQLPEDVQRQARAAYRVWKRNPHHPGFHFRRIHPTEPVYSVRIGCAWRALGLQGDHGQIIWFWIGSHADYDRLLLQF